MRIVFMGTPDIAVPTLEALAKHPSHEVVGVISQPDRPKDRGKKLQPTPVKATALTLGLSVYQPERIKSPEAYELIQTLNPDIIVVIAYGQILPKRVLDHPKHGTINIHGSLLPKYRGASPIQQAILNGDAVTGITIMQMDAGMDTGDMILKESFPIPGGYTSGDLFVHMGALAPKPLLEALAQIEAGTAVRTPQGDDFTHAPMLDKELGCIQWDQSSETIVNLIHGLNPWPGAFTHVGNEVLKIWRGQVLEGTFTGQVGEILTADPKEGLIVKTGDGAILLTEIQKKGGKRLSATEFLKGHTFERGSLCFSIQP